jgi:ABC-type branched-subunit amino acid transport system substrate-binding protein
MLKRIVSAAFAALIALTIVLPAGAKNGHRKHHPRRLASTATQVVVPRGHPLEVAFTPDLTGLTSGFAASLADAVQMAVESHPAVRGFPIQINTVNTPCGDATADLAAATSVVGHLQNAAVLGPFCSTADVVALPIYETAHLVTLSGSTTDPSLPPLGPHVFNSVAISDQCCPYVAQSGPWYATVAVLPSDLEWRQSFAEEFGAAPMSFADLYYDATRLLIRQLQNTSSIDRSGNLLINRAALAQAVRGTANYDGVTCTITLDEDGYRTNDVSALDRCADN